MKKVVGLLLIATLLLVATAIVAFLKDKQNSDLRIAKLNVEMKLNNAKRQVQSMEGDVVRIKERNTFLSENVTRLEDEAQKALDEAMSAKQQSSLDARDIIQKAENEAREIRASAEQYASMIEGKMQEVYGDLKQYKDGVNLVEGKYLDSFEITGNRIIINMRNRTNHSVRPDLHISFFDRNGFVIASISESWLLDSIDSGGRRVEDNTIYFRHGAIPYYYTASE